MCDLIKCDSCRCKPVCKECSNFELYVQQYLECRENSVLFDQDPKCPYYIEKKSLDTDKVNVQKECSWCKCIRINRARIETGKLYDLSTLQCPECGAYHLVPSII